MPFGSWRTVQVADLGKIVTGRTPPTEQPEYFGDVMPFITPTDMDGRRSIDRPHRWLSAQGAKLLERNIITKGVAVSCIGWQMGKSILIRQSSVTNQQLNSIIADERVVDLEYLYYSFVNRRYELFRLASGGSRTPILKKSDFEKLPVVLPPLPEQRAIASILGAFDDKIELNRRMSRTLEEMARALFKSWFVDFDPVRAAAEGRDPGLPAEIAALFPAGFEETELGEVPRGWRVVSIGDLVEVRGGSTPSTKVPEYWEGGTICWATPKDLSKLSTPVLLDTERKITDAGLTQISSGLLPKGTVLLSSRAPIGYLAIAEMPVAVNQGFIAMVPQTEVSNLFVLLWAKSSHEMILSRANGSTFLEISKRNFRPLPIVWPPQPVMVAFDKLVRPIYERIVLNEQQSRLLASIRDTLLPKLLSGEVRVAEAAALV